MYWAPPTFQSLQIAVKPLWFLGRRPRTLKHLITNDSKLPVSLFRHVCYILSGSLAHPVGVSDHLCVLRLSMSQNECKPPTASSKATVSSLGMLPLPSKSPCRERGKGPGHHTAAHHAHQPRNLTVLHSGAAAMLVPDPQLVSCSPSHCPSSPGLSSSPQLLHSTSDGCESRTIIIIHRDPAPHLRKINTRGTLSVCL